MSTTALGRTGDGHGLTSEILDQKPPCDPEAEQSAIGSVLLDPGRFEEIAFLKPADFYDRRLAILYRHLIDMHQDGAIDTTLLLARLRESGELEKAGSAAYLTEVTQSVAVAAHAGHYADIVRDRALKRAVVLRATEALRDAYSGQSTGDALLRRYCGELERLGDGARPAGMVCISAAELDATDYEVKYLVDGLLVANQPAIVGGKQKTLKTSLLVALTVALVLGRKFLGVFDVPRACRVAFVSCESGLGALQETFRRVCIAHCRAMADLSGLVVSDSIPRLDDPACISALQDFCTDHEAEVLVLDPAYMMMSGADAGNLLTMGERLGALNCLASVANVTVILAHHLKKNRGSDSDRYSPPQLEEIAWSGFAEFARQWLLLGRRSEYEDGSGKHDLWMRAGGSAGHTGLWGVDVLEGLRTDPGGRVWEVDVRPGSEIIEMTRQDQADRKEEKQRAADDAGQKAIVEAMSTNLKRGEGAFLARLRTMTGIGEQRLTRLLAQLSEKGITESCSALRSPTHKTPQDGAHRLSGDWWKDE